MTNNEAKNVLENVWDFAILADEDSGDILEKAIDIANIALDTVEKIKEIITEVQHYEVSNSFESPHPNKADYDAVSADKFKRIWKVISEAGIESDNYCEWFKYDYRTIAPRNHDVSNPYWRIPENMDKLKYCPYCGKEIKVVD